MFKAFCIKPGWTLEPGWSVITCSCPIIFIAYARRTICGLRLKSGSPIGRENLRGATNDVNGGFSPGAGIIVCGTERVTHRNGSMYRRTLYGKICVRALKTGRLKEEFLIWSGLAIRKCPV